MVRVTLTSSEAADRLDISTQRLRQLIVTGDIDAERHGHVWAIDPASVDDYGRGRRPTAGRSLSPRMAWAALLSNFGTELTDDIIEAFALRRTERSRLSKLSDRDPNEWRWLARRRATTQRFNTFDAYLDRLDNTDDVVRTGISAIADHRVDLVAHQRSLDVYATPATVAELIASMRLTPTSTGNLTLRSIGNLDPIAFVLERNVMPGAVVAVDLLDDADTRTARAGIDLIETILDGH
jgi:hypothetical protein